MDLKNLKKKETLEKLLVLGLLGVFAVTLVTGPLKNLGLMGQSATAAVVPSGGMPGQTTGLGQEPSSVSSSPATSQTSEVQPGAALYSAGELRDPFESQLPKPPAPVLAEAAGASDSIEVAPAIPPPPALHVTGLLWGGPTPKAIVDGQIYGVDDLVNGEKIIAIDHRGMTIDHYGTPIHYSPASSEGVEGSMTQQAHQWR